MQNEKKSYRKLWTLLIIVGVLVTVTFTGVLETWIDDMIDNMEQKDTDERNRVQQRVFKDTMFINEDGSEERAFKIPEGHSKEGSGAAAISETEARKYFKDNPDQFESLTFEDAVASLELEIMKYAVNKASGKKQ
jgi:hypothetical protein